MWCHCGRVLEMSLSGINGHELDDGIKKAIA